MASQKVGGSVKSKESQERPTCALVLPLCVYSSQKKKKWQSRGFVTCWPTGKRKNVAFVSNICMLLHSRPGYRQEIPLSPLWFSQGRQDQLILKMMLRIHLATTEEGGGGNPSLAVFASVQKTGFVRRLHGGGTDPGCLGTVSLQREQGWNMNRVRTGVWTGGMQQQSFPEAVQER